MRNNRKSTHTFMWWLWKRVIFVGLLAWWIGYVSHKVSVIIPSSALFVFLILIWFWNINARLFCQRVGYVISKKGTYYEQEKLLFQLKSGNKFPSFTSISTLLSDRQKVPVVFTINTERVIKTTKRPNNNTHIRIYIAQSDELNRPRSFCRAAEALP